MVSSMNLNELAICSFGIQAKDLAGRAEHLMDGTPLNQEIVLQCWQGIKNYPLSKMQKDYLRNRLLAQQVVPALWRILRPTIAIYRWPNNELRYFLVSADGHLLEDQSSEQFFPYFPILKKNNDNQWVLSGHGRQIDAPHLDLCWLPQNHNYSHFLCDYLGPCLALKAWVGINGSLPLLYCEPWQAWQKEYLKRLPLNYVKVPSPHAGELMFVRPGSVRIPMLPSVMQSQLTLRSWLHQNIAISPESNVLPKIPILIERTGHKQKRIRNLNELQLLVRAYGGLSVDPTSLSLQQRLELFRQASLIIGDGSSSMNFILFASNDCHYIGLCDPESIINNHYLEGGWPYTHLIASRSTFIVGKDTSQLPGSTLGSSIYSTSLIENTLQSFLK